MPCPKHTIGIGITPRHLNVTRLTLYTTLHDMTTANDPRDAAWTDLEHDLDNFFILRSTGPGDLRDIHEDTNRSKLARLLDIARSITSSPDQQNDNHLDAVLDLIVDNMPDDLIYVKATIKPLSRYIMIANLNGSSRPLPFAPAHARQVLTCLMDLFTDEMHVPRVYDTVKILARPYIPHLDSTDPLVLALTTPSTTTDQSSISPSSPTSLPPHLAELSRHLDDPSIPLSAPFHLTPGDLLTLLAPAYLHILQSAPSPPLGIPSRYAQTTTDQANTFAGKVYSSHEFRNREAGLPMGLGVGRRGSNQAQFRGYGYGHGHGHGAEVTTQGMGPGINMDRQAGADAARGLGAGGPVTARPASRHVDEYAR